MVKRWSPAQIKALLPVTVIRVDQQLSAHTNMTMEMKDVFSKFPLKQLSTFVAFIVIFVYNGVLDRDLECSCNQQLDHCSEYMILPFFILFVLQLWKDKNFQRVCQYTCRIIDRRFLMVMLNTIIKASFFGLLWVVAVLIDGDWFVCCQNYKSEQYPDLACKDQEKNITLEEWKVVTELKGLSLVSCCSYKLSVCVSYCDVTLI